MEASKDRLMSMEPICRGQYTNSSPSLMMVLRNTVCEASED
jgi:hypothetical protein